jgi:hypothetical protein
MLDKLTIDDFKDRIGETFKVTPEEGEPFVLELRRADPSPYAEQETDEGRDAREREPFSLEFNAGQTEEFAPQQTFSVAHEDLGQFDLFMVPLGPDAEGHRYEAVFG